MKLDAIEYQVVKTSQKIVRNGRNGIKWYLKV